MQVSVFRTVEMSITLQGGTILNSFLCMQNSKLKEYFQASYVKFCLLTIGWMNTTRWKGEKKKGIKWVIEISKPLKAWTVSSEILNCMEKASLSGDEGYVSDTTPLLWTVHRTYEAKEKSLWSGVAQFTQVAQLGIKEQRESPRHSSQDTTTSL